MPTNSDIVEKVSRQVSFQSSNHCLLVTLNGDLNREISRAMTGIIVSQCHKIRSEQGVILDFSGIDFMDANSFEEFEKVFRMIRIIGQRVIISGLKAGIISALMDFEFDASGIKTALNLEDAYLILKEAGNGD